MQLDIAQSTPTAASIGRLVQAHYPFGNVVASEFLRRSFNQVYRVDFAGGRREAAFFDFDEAGPGYLAYELSVYPWSMYPRSPDGVVSEKVSERWRRFIGAYRQTRAVGDADLAAIAPFMAVRQFWLLGEYAGRVPVWGSQAMPTDYLRRQAAMLRQWETLELPLL